MEAKIIKVLVSCENKCQLNVAFEYMLNYIENYGIDKIIIDTYCFMKLKLMR